MNLHHKPMDNFNWQNISLNGKQVRKKQNTSVGYSFQSLNVGNRVEAWKALIYYSLFLTQKKWPQQKLQ